jgi:hypothetical protein
MAPSSRSIHTSLRTSELEAYAQGVMAEASRIGDSYISQTPPGEHGYIHNEEMEAATESIAAHMQANHPELNDSAIDGICNRYVAGFGLASGSDREGLLSWGLRMAATFAEWTQGRKYDPDPWQ